MSVEQRQPSPQLILWGITGLFAAAATATLLYPPEYLALPMLWAGIASIAALLAATTAIWHRPGCAALAGAWLIFAALSRALALTIQAIFSLDRSLSPAALWLGVVQWTVGGLMIWALWEHVILRWVARRRVVPDRRDPLVPAPDLSRELEPE